MARKATIFKTTVEIADLERHYFESHSLTLAQHPSETEDRLMIRLLAWCCYAHADLHFTRGLSEETEPEIWQHADNGTLERWIELGLPDEKRLKKACSLAKQVVLFTYQSRPALVWKKQQFEKLSHFKNLTIWYLDDHQLSQLSGLAQRNMQLQVTLQEGIIWIADGHTTLEITLQPWQIHNE